MERFDIHKWKPTECRNVAEIEAALRKFNVIGKKIVSLRTIGAAENFNYYGYDDEISWVKNCEEEQKQCVNNAMLPLRAILNEPVIFEFEDDSTLEIMSKGKGTLLIASNQIPHGIKDGINSSNFNSEMFFGRIKNSSLTGQVSEHTSEEHSYYFTSEAVEYGFYLNRDSVKQNLYVAVSCVYRYANKEFVLSMNKKTSQSDNSCIKISATEYKNASYNSNQVIIYEGKMMGGYFDIYPINRKGKHEYPPLGKYEIYKDLINIDDIDINCYLTYFLEKYFDEDYDYDEMRDEHSDGFEYYSEFNLYTYGTVRKMIEDIKSYADMLENDLENPALDKLKDSIAQGGADPQYPKSKEEKLKAIKENVPVAIDFYRRLSARLEDMMKNAPDYEFICFMGP